MFIFLLGLVSGLVARSLYNYRRPLSARRVVLVRSVRPRQRDLFAEGRERPLQRGNYSRPPF